MKIFTVQKTVESLVPGVSPESWDNTGVLINAYNNDADSTLLLTIDMTEAVVDECIEKKISHILSYHPVIFPNITRLDKPSLVKCIRNGISVYCPHTLLDPLINEHIKELVGARSTLEKAVPLLKKLAGVNTLRVVRGNDGDIAKDVVVGAGAAFRGANLKDKLVITGELGHHDLLRCKAQNTSLVLMEHSNSERFYLSVLKELLVEKMEGWRIEISKADQDPMEFM